MSLNKAELEERHQLTIELKKRKEDGSHAGLIVQQNKIIQHSQKATGISVEKRRQPRLIQIMTVKNSLVNVDVEEICPS